MTLLEIQQSSRGLRNVSTNYLSIGNHEHILISSPEDALLKSIMPRYILNTSPKAMATTSPNEHINSSSPPIAAGHSRLGSVKGSHHSLATAITIIQCLTNLGRHKSNPTNVILIILAYSSSSFPFLSLQVPTYLNHNQSRPSVHSPSTSATLLLPAVKNRGESSNSPPP